MLEKEIFGTSIIEKHFLSAQELLDTLLVRSFSSAGDSIFTPDRWIFRGNANSDWQLQPTAFRDGLKEELLFRAGRASVPLGNLETTQIFSEYIQLFRFYKKLEKHGLIIPDNSPELRRIFEHPTRLVAFLVESSQSQNCSWPPPEIHGIMALAQHYKLSTRLLDWTSDPLVACYFATESSAAPHLAVWCLDTSSLSNAKFETSLIYAASNSNPNLNAQQGLFTVSTVNFCSGDFNKVADTRSLEDRVPKIPSATNRPTLLKLTLPRTQSSELKSKLQQFGYTTAKIFPGYQGVVDEMNRDSGFASSKNPSLAKFDCNLIVFIPEHLHHLGNSIAALIDPDVGGNKSFDIVKLSVTGQEPSQFRYCGGQIGRESLAYLLQDVAMSIPGIFYYIYGGSDAIVFATNIEGAEKGGESLDSLATKLNLQRIFLTEI